MKHPPKDKKAKRLLRRPDAYQGDRLKAALPFLARRRTAVDVGAHIGMWSVQLADNFERVIAIEPHPDSYVCLVENVGVIGVDTRQCALGEAPGWLGLCGHGLAAHLCGRGDETEPFTKVGVTTLDNLKLTDLDFLKIDVEGFETFVLRGGEETIRRDRPVIVIEQKYEQRYGLDDRAAVTLLRKWGAVVQWRRKNDYCLRWST